jgi:hypothetical protein
MAAQGHLRGKGISGLSYSGIDEVPVVPYPGRRECSDPVSEDAILGKGGGDSPDRVKGRQLASDTGGDKT